MNVIAEGVEIEVHRKFLKHMTDHAYQAYLFN
jgi:EAL domain-containing protein (putative c-di-GMP-specific phosphodiesterase class I)